MPDFTQHNEPPFLLMHGDVFMDYIEFSGEDELEVLDKVNNFKQYTKAEYHALKDDFYGESKTYIYDIIGGNASLASRANLINRFIPNSFQIIRDHPGKTFADFGGGVGAVCSIVHALGTKEVTYIDLESYMTDFARFRFKKHNENVNIVIIPEDDFTLPQRYDVIFTDAVWEHLKPDQQIRYLEKIANDCLNPGGLFFLLIDLSGENPDMPMHYNVDIVKCHQTLATNGMRCVGGQNSFASLWVR